MRGIKANDARATELVLCGDVMKDEEHLSILEKVALDEKRYRTSRRISAITFIAFGVLLIIGTLVVLAV